MEIEPYDPDEPESEEDRIDEKDYEGASLDDVYNDMKHAQHVEWPNDAYREFMEITTRYQLSNSASDAMIHFLTNFQIWIIRHCLCQYRLERNFWIAQIFVTTRLKRFSSPHFRISSTPCIIDQ